MAVLSVDYAQLENGAKAVEQYLSRLKETAQMVDHKLLASNGSWSGKDAVRFKQSWEEMKNKGALAQEKNSLTAYRDSLRKAAEEYRKLQLLLTECARLL